MNTIFKPTLSGQIGGGNAGLIIDQPNAYKTVQVVDAKGNVIDTMSPTSSTRGESGFKYTGTKPGSAYGDNVYLRFSNDNKNYGYMSLPSGNQGYGGDINHGDLSGISSMENAAKLNAYEHASSSTGPYSPGQIGHGFYPGNIESMFPTAKTIGKIQTAPYQFTDPQAFAKSFGEFNRGEYQKNFAQAQGFALDALDTELQAMQHYVPAQSALKRQQTSIDNIFNQQQRTQQVNSTLPGVNDQLNAQASRANSYANGQLPDQMQDRALELGIRSQAADRSTAGGFGAQSSAARKASDLMSASQRLQIGQYGEQLLGTNINQKASLNLAPTEYSNAGTQVNVNPTVSPAQLTMNSLADINNATLISPTNALSSVTQQQQYKTNLETANRQFNSGIDQFNANTQNTFAMKKWDYQVGYANTVAGAAQINANTNLAQQQQQQAQDQANKTAKQAQTANTINSVIAAAGPIISAIKGTGTSGTSKPTPGTTVDGGGTVQPDNSIKYPDGSTISSDGTVRDGSGAVQGRFETNSDGSETYHPVQGPEAPSSGNTTTTTTTSPDQGTTEVPNNGDDNTLPGSGHDQIVPAGSTINEDNTVTGPDGSNVGQVDPSTGQFYPTTTEIPQDTQTYAQMGGISKEKLQQIMGGGPSTNGKITTLPGKVNMTPAQTAAVMKAVTGSSDSVLVNAGVYPKPEPGTTPMGYNIKGQQVHFDKQLMQDASTVPAQQKLDNLDQIVSPLGTEVKQKDIADIKEKATNPDNINELNTLAQKKDTKGFIDAMLNQQTGGNKVETPEGLTLALSAAKLYENWDRMSTAQKTLGMTSLALQAYKTDSGKTLAQVEIPMTKIDGQKALTVGGALDLAAMGYNVSQIALNWGDLSNAQKIIGGAQTAADGVRIASDMGLIDKSNAAVKAAGYLGPAVAAYQLTQNWGKMNDEQRTVAATRVAYSASSAAGYNYPVVGYGLAAYDTVKALQSANEHWGEGGTKNRQSGMQNTAAYTAEGWSVGGPIGAAVGLVVGLVCLAGTSIKTGKSDAQTARDWFRDDLKSKGLYDENYRMRMPDGSTPDVGLDGGATHAARDAGQLAPGTDSKLKAYATDYTNDMDFAAGNAGMTLSRLLYGGREKRVDQTGQQMGNAMLGTVGYGKDMTKENFEHVMTNARATYAQAGIKTKEDAYGLVDMMKSLGRITNADAIQMQTSLNMMYDKNGYDTTQKVFQGRHVYTSSLSKLPPRSDIISVGPSTPIANVNPYVSRVLRSKEDIRAANRQQFMAA